MSHDQGWETVMRRHTFTMDYSSRAEPRFRASAAALAPALSATALLQDSACRRHYSRHGSMSAGPS